MTESFALAKAQDRISELMLALAAQDADRRVQVGRVIQLETAIKAALDELADNSEPEAILILRHALTQSSISDEERSKASVYTNAHTS